MESLQISLFGGFYLAKNDRNHRGQISHRGRALLTYLIIECERPHLRPKLAALLWPNHPETVALANLRQTIHRVRKALETPTNDTSYILNTSQDIQFNIYSQCRIDVVIFLRSLDTLKPYVQSPLSITKDCLASYQHAADLYAGDLMAGFSLPGSHYFEWWLSCRREEYHALMINLLDCLISYFEKERNYGLAIRYAQRAIELEPWNEYFHRKKMIAMASNGNRLAALRQYKLCCEILMEEFGIQPTAETSRLNQLIASVDFSASYLHASTVEALAQ